MNDRKYRKEVLEKVSRFDRSNELKEKLNFRKV